MKFSMLVVIGLLFSQIINAQNLVLIYHGSPRSFQSGMNVYTLQSGKPVRSDIAKLAVTAGNVPVSNFIYNNGVPLEKAHWWIQENFEKKMAADGFSKSKSPGLYYRFLSAAGPAALAATAAGLASPDSAHAADVRDASGNTTAVDNNKDYSAKPDSGAARFRRPVVVQKVEVAR